MTIWVNRKTKTNCPDLSKVRMVYHTQMGKYASEKISMYTKTLWVIKNIFISPNNIRKLRIVRDLINVLTKKQNLPSG